MTSKGFGALVDPTGPNIVLDGGIAVCARPLAFKRDLDHISWREILLERGVRLEGR